MRRSSAQILLCAGALGVGLVAWAASAPPVGYAVATGYYKKATRPTLYQPLNLLDAREATVWCSPSADTLSDSLTFGFKGQARIDEIRIYTGNGSDDSTFEEYSKAKKLTFRGPNNAYSFTVANQRGLQAFQVSPPLVGAVVNVEILDQYPAEDPESPVCVTDIVFYSDGKPLNGAWMTKRLKYDKHKAQVLGTWYTGYEGAPDRFLSFFFDGTFRFTFEPFEGRPRSFSGTYTTRAGRVVLEVPGKGRWGAKLDSQKIEDPLSGDSERRTLRFEGAVPEDLKQTYRDVK